MAITKKYLINFINYKLHYLLSYTYLYFYNYHLLLDIIQPIELIDHKN